MASVRSRLPSTRTCPPVTVLPPVPALHCVLVQPLGRLVPSNSAPMLGARMTSPPLVFDTYVLVPVAPAVKSATVSSVAAGNGKVKLAGALARAGQVVALV